MKPNARIYWVGGSIVIAMLVLFVARMVVTAHQPSAATPQLEATHAKPTDRVPVAVPAPLLHPEPRVPAADILRYAEPNKLFLRSSVALVMDEREGVMLYERNIDEPRPIASLTKLMTAVVILDAKLPLDETIEITRADRDRLKGSKSRLRYGTVLTRQDMLQVALAASDNRAASALARTYPGGRDAMVEAMNAKAKELAMTQTHFVDASGLHKRNTSSARDLLKLASAIRDYPLISTMTTGRQFRVTDKHDNTEIAFGNTNYLVHKDTWNIALSKTGYTAEAGNCILMRTTIAERPLVIVLLNSWGKLSKYGDSNRIRSWLLDAERKILTHARAAANT
jgi:D-alanyl-D-alanine endopeptidase (penicillin-binding protein 7)